jgi:Glycosyl transferase family 11
MISINLMGGLGNQLFQIFTTIAYAIKHKHKFVFPYSDKLAQRVTYWNNFMLSLKLFTTSNLNNRVTNNEIQNMDVIGERDFRYNELPQTNPLNSFKLHGYFQSYKYFENELEQIYGLFRLEQQKQKIMEEYAHLFSFDGAKISMHFRLGDYKQLQHYHPIMPPDYFQNALTTILEKGELENATILYFCEEEDNNIVLQFIDILRLHFSSSKWKNINFVKVDDTIADWKQMLLMSCCDHNIIANSSFSWWGAYMNSSANKIVCYPSLWFGQTMHDHHGFKDTQDLFPEKWIKINT